MSEGVSGILMKSLGGFYYVRCGEKVYECKARGSIRKGNISPAAGDRVSVLISSEGYSVLEEVLPRKNYLCRPALANVDLLVIVCSTVDPLPNLGVIDKMTAAAVNTGMEPVIAVTKNDLENGEKIADIYRCAGFEVFLCSDGKTSQASQLKAYLMGKVSAFIGNSGVGKSTLLNSMFPTLSLQTGETSKKLGRGRHTTRAVELYEIDGCFVADTPGFSTVDLRRYEMMDKTRLQYCFPEFEQYLGQCRFVSCSHTCEDGCKILDALSLHKIAKTRHDSYVQMYNEVKDIKPWQIKE